MCKPSFHIFCLSKCHWSNSKLAGYIIIFILIWWLMEVDMVKVICLSEYWCCTDFHARMCRSAEESRFADETVNNDADVLFCPVEKTSAVFGRKRVCDTMFTYISLFFCRETLVKQENQAHRETSALQYGKNTYKQTKSHMQHPKTSLLKVPE